MWFREKSNLLTPPPTPYSEYQYESEDGVQDQSLQEQRLYPDFSCPVEHKSNAMRVGIGILSLLALSQIVNCYLSASTYRLTRAATLSTSPHVYDCGNTTAEARARDCTFELLTVSWVPPACADESLDAEFRSLGFHYFADEANTRGLTYEELADRPWQFAWTTNEQHLMHCAFLWRKMHRAVEAGRRQSDRALDYEHTVHCSGLIVNPGRLDENINIIPDFARCY